MSFTAHKGQCFVDRRQGGEVKGKLCGNGTERTMVHVDTFSNNLCDSLKKCRLSFRRRAIKAKSLVYFLIWKLFTRFIFSLFFPRVYKGWVVNNNQDDIVGISIIICALDYILRFDWTSWFVMQLIKITESDGKR